VFQLWLSLACGGQAATGDGCLSHAMDSSGVLGAHSWRMLAITLHLALATSAVRTRTVCHRSVTLSIFLTSIHNGPDASIERDVSTICHFRADPTITSTR